MPSANDERWVVAFAGARDSYQVPTALHDSGLLQMQPYPAGLKAALKSDELMREFQDQIRNEATWPPEVFHKYSREPQLADACIVASSYTRKTLVENGVAPDRIFTIPYGVDLEFFSPVERQSEKFSVLFVGQLCRQKGLHYLLEAWRHLRPLNAELRIVGHPLKSEIAAEYASI